MHMQYCLIGVCIFDLERALNQNAPKRNGKKLTSNQMTFIAITFDAWRERRNEGRKSNNESNDPLCLSFCHIATTASFCCSCCLVPRFSFCFDRWFSYQLWMHFKQIFFRMKAHEIQTCTHKWSWMHSARTGILKQHCTVINVYAHTHLLVREEVINERIKHIDINFTFRFTTEKCISIESKNQMPYFLFFSRLLCFALFCLLILALPCIL